MQYIAHRLLLNNEMKKWFEPSHNISSSDLDRQDNEIFKLARLINCVQFKNVVVEDFIKAITGLPSVGPNANLDVLTVNMGIIPGISSNCCDLSFRI